MAMDAAPALKRKDAGAPEVWMDDGGATGFPTSSRATKIRRLDAEGPPVVPGDFVSPLQQPVTGLGAAGVPMCGHKVSVGVAAPAPKRKGEDSPELWLDDDAASGFPVSSRATKIRRLDAEVPPVVPDLCAPPPQQPVAGLGATELQMCGNEVPVAVVPAPNEERAIVLYKQADAARNLLLSPLRPEVPLGVSPDWIYGLKSTMLREASEHRALFEQLPMDESSNLAMVPWVPSNSQEASTSAAATEMIDAEDTSMEVEQDEREAHLATTAGVAQGGEAPYHHQWQPQQQQHCMVQQQPLLAASYQPSPVTWSW